LPKESRNVVKNKGTALRKVRKSPQHAEKTRLERETELECAARKHAAAEDTVRDVLGTVAGGIKRRTEELAVAAPPSAA